MFLKSKMEENFLSIEKINKLFDYEFEIHIKWALASKIISDEMEKEIYELFVDIVY